MAIARIMENWVYEDNVDVTASTEDANFPVSNMKNFFRAKTWRSNSAGKFVIQTGVNQDIDFSDGVVRSATVTAGTYTSTTLATEIQTQMDAASTDTITCTYSTTTGKWTIASDGGTFELLWDTGASSATSIGAAIGFDTSADDTGSTSYTGADIAIHTEESVTIDIKTTDDVDSFVMFFDPNLGNRLTQQAVVKLQGNHADVWASPVVSETLTFDEDIGVYSKFFTTKQSLRYWRVQIVDPTNPDLYVQIGKIVLSDATTLTRQPEIGFSFTQTDRSRFQVNEYGNRFTDIFPIQKSMEIDLALMDETDATELLEFYDRTGITKPVVYTLDPEGTQLTTNRFMIYGYFAPSLTLEHEIRDIFNTSLSIEETF